MEAYEKMSRKFCRLKLCYDFFQGKYGFYKPSYESYFNIITKKERKKVSTSFRFPKKLFA